MANSVLYGILNSKDLAANLTPQNVIITIDRDLVIGAVEETVEQHNLEINELRKLFADPTTDYSLFYKGYIGNDLQEGDENQDPLPVKGISHYSVGFPIREGKTAWGANYTTLNQMTLQDFSDRTDQMLLGDVNWNRKWTLGTLLFDGNNGTAPTNGVAAGTNPYTFVDVKYGNISVYGLANGDATTYNKLGSTTPATDSHYTAQNGAISDTSGQNPFPTIETALLEHPENMGPLLSLIDPALATTVKALAGFTPATTIIDARTAILAKPGSTTPTFAGADLPQLPSTAQIIGSYDRTYIATWRTIPTNIILTLNLGGPKPLLFRQYPQPALQGFGPVGFFNGQRRQIGDDFPYFKERWYRAGGFGGYNRVGAHVHQVGSSTTYAMPSTYYPLFGRTS